MIFRWLWRRKIARAFGPGVDAAYARQYADQDAPTEWAAFKRVIFSIGSKPGHRL